MFMTTQKTEEGGGRGGEEGREVHKITSEETARSAEGFHVDR